MNSKKTVFCLWSGGLDSTYMIWRYLSEGYSVYAGYVEILNNKEKTKTEKKAIQSLNKILKKYEFHYCGTILKIEIPGFNCFNTCFQQLPIWLISLLLSYNTDEISIGYVMKDDIISYLNDVRKVYKSFNHISKQKLPSLEFPLIKISKDQIYRNTPDNLKKHTVFCENPIITNSNNFKPCGNCGACKTRFNLEINMEIPIKNHILVNDFINNYKKEKRKTNEKSNKLRKNSNKIMVK